MKTIAAAAITAAALVAGCHAGPGAIGGNTPADKDRQFINDLKSHGLHAPPGMDESQWEKLSIDTAHSTCDMMGMTMPQPMGGSFMRGQALIDNSEGEAKIRNEATIRIYCPEKR